MSFFEAGIDWSKGNCVGMPLNDFFIVEEKRQSVKLQKELMDVIRPTCFSCPIWAKCLTWGFRNENFGVWGGLTSSERQSFSDPKPSEIRGRAILALNTFAITEKQVRELM